MSTDIFVRRCQSSRVPPKCSKGRVRSLTLKSERRSPTRREHVNFFQKFASSSTRPSDFPRKESAEGGGPRGPSEWERASQRRDEGEGNIADPIIFDSQSAPPQSSAGVLACEFGRRLASRSFRRRDASRTRSRDLRATKKQKAAFKSNAAFANLISGRLTAAAPGSSA